MLEECDCYFWGMLVLELLAMLGESVGGDLRIQWFVQRYGKP